MYCSKCGHENPDDYNFCKNCGQDLGHAKAPHAKSVPNYLAFSIIMIFLCLPFGIAGLVYSLKVDEFLMQGDTEAAKAASDKARKLDIIGLIVLGALICIPFIIALISLIFIVPAIPFNIIVH
ncbi:MAG: CD225/dispanin family protein [Christensenellales bacterium]